MGETCTNATFTPFPKIWNDNKFNNETAMKKYKDFLNKNKQK